MLFPTRLAAVPANETNKVKLIHLGSASHDSSGPLAINEVVLNYCADQLPTVDSFGFCQ
jgi:hypothetical protein